jgi:molybdopterin-guanine dinucleotide biosynthesis protein A
MGTPKALLEWHGSTLLRRAVGIVARAVDGPVVVVRAHEQVLPALPPQAEIAADAREGRGPLQGIAAGLAAIGERATVVYVSGVDAPLLHPAFVRHVLRSLRADDDVALPRAHGFAQPLAAAYRTAALAPRLHELIARDRLGTRDLFEQQLAVCELDEAALLADPDVAALDPELASLLNLNEPGEYEAARARPAPSITVRVSGHNPHRRVQAATLRAAADAAGLTRAGAGLTATLDGHGDVDDPHEPLVTGDVVTFHAQGS